MAMTELPSATVIAGVVIDPARAAGPPGASAVTAVMAMAVPAKASSLTLDLTAITRRPVLAALTVPAAPGPDGTALTRRRATAGGLAQRSFMLSPGR